MRRESFDSEGDVDPPRQPSWRSRPAPPVRPGKVTVARLELQVALAEVVRGHDELVVAAWDGRTVQNERRPVAPAKDTAEAVLAAVVRCADAVSHAMVPHFAQPTGGRPESFGASRVATVVMEAAKDAGLRVDVPAPMPAPPVTGAIDPDSDLDDWADRDAAAEQAAIRKQRAWASSRSKSKAVQDKWTRRRANRGKKKRTR